MPGYTKTFTVTNASAVAIVAQTNAGQITVREDPSVVSYPTTAFLVMKPTSSSQGVTRAKGESYVFQRADRRLPCFQPGEVVGYVQLPSAGSTTFSQDEN